MSLLRTLLAPSSMLLVASLSTIAGLAGCAYGEVRQVVRAQFAAEHNCTEVTLEKRQLWYVHDSPDQFKVTGCGVLRTYTCPKSDGLVSYDEPACTWVEGDADAPKMATSGGEDDELEGHEEEPLEGDDLEEPAGETEADAEADAEPDEDSGDEDSGDED